MTTADRIRALLNLTSLPREGGYFVETYRSPISIQAEARSGSTQGSRSLATAIYYMLTPETFSAMHRLSADEIYHFYWGDPVELLLLDHDGPGRVLVLGPDLLHGMHPQAIVPSGTWQGSRLAPGGRFALLGTTMAPGFDEKDFLLGSRSMLLQAYPKFRDLLTALTRDKASGASPS